jgi:hypothetical protein
MDWACRASTALTARPKGAGLLGSGVLLANEKPEQLTTNRLAMPQAAIARLLQRLVPAISRLRPQESGAVVGGERLFYRQQHLAAVRL